MEQLPSFLGDYLMIRPIPHGIQPPHPGFPLKTVVSSLRETNTATRSILRSFDPQRRLLGIDLAVGTYQSSSQIMSFHHGQAMAFLSPATPELSPVAG